MEEMKVLNGCFKSLEGTATACSCLNFYQINDIYHIMKKDLERVYDKYVWHDWKITYVETWGSEFIDFNSKTDGRNREICCSSSISTYCGWSHS